MCVTVLCQLNLCNSDMQRPLIPLMFVSLTVVVGEFLQVTANDRIFKIGKRPLLTNKMQNFFDKDEPNVCP